MNTEKKIIIQKDDLKSFKWAELAKVSGIKFLPQPGSPIKAPFFLIKEAACRGVPSGYVVRYLNDYPALLKTLLRLISEIFLVALCTLFNIKVFWICHNVDKESSTHYPRISKLRRWMFSLIAKRIFVTDPLLIPHAKKYFPVHAHKIDSISFGRLDLSYEADYYKEKAAIEFLEKKQIEAKSEGMEPLVLFCAGSPGNNKYLHFDHMENLIAAGRRAGYQIIAVVAGDFLKSIRGSILLEGYKKNPAIFAFESFTQFSPAFICQYVDFYWRGYDDYSVPFTIYESSTLKKPVLSLQSGFLPEMIEAYHLGEVITYPFDDIGIVLDKLKKSVSGYLYDSFLNEHEWLSLSLKLKETL
ncbi:MAG: hypothetical protein ACQEW0_17890 [Pseudomonadota bacterium]